MRKVEDFGVGALALLFFSTPSIGQERLDPEIERQRRFNMSVALNFHWMASSSSARTASPLMQGELETVVEEMHAAMASVRGGDLSAALAALDTTGRATMKMRRLLWNIEKAPEPEIRSAGGRSVTRAPLPEGRLRVVASTAGADQQRITPLQQATETLEWAVNLLLHAGDVRAATATLDEVDRAAAALRDLLWKKKRD